jgi:thioredoxin 1
MLLIVAVAQTNAQESRVAVNIPDLLGKGAPVMLQFEEKWCPYCREMEPTLSDLEREYSGKLTIARVNGTANRELASKYGIRVVPTQVFLTQDGSEFARNQGMLDKQRILDILGRMGLKRAAQASLTSE